MPSLSKINARLTEAFLLAPGKEGQYFERKSARIDMPTLAKAICAFANADGGTIVIGINNRQIEGINAQGNTKINDFLQ